MDYFSIKNKKNMEKINADDCNLKKMRCC